MKLSHPILFVVSLTSIFTEGLSELNCMQHSPGYLPFDRKDRPLNLFTEGGTVGP